MMISQNVQDDLSLSTKRAIHRWCTELSDTLKVGNIQIFTIRNARYHGDLAWHVFIECHSHHRNYLADILLSYILCTHRCRDTQCSVTFHSAVI